MELKISKTEISNKGKKEKKITPPKKKGGAWKIVLEENRRATKLEQQLFKNKNKLLIAILLLDGDFILCFNIGQSCF